MVLKTLSEDDYYNLHDLMTRGAAWNFIIGARGLGKTYADKRYGIKEAIKNGHEFIYLRRTDVEQKKKETFFRDIQEAFPDYDFRINGDKGEYRHHSWDEKQWRICCYFIALSQAGGLKSVAYPNVYTIIFDEIFPDNVRFLSNEVNSFSEFYNTVDRWNDRVRVLFLSNAVQKANPYFAKYALDLTDQEAKQLQFKTYCGGYICIELADYGGFSAKVSKSRFGQFLERFDPDYADYAIRNKFRDDSKDMVQDIPEFAEYSYTLDTELYGSFGVFIDVAGKSLNYYISRRVKRNSERHYTLDYSKVTEEVIYIKKSDDITKRMTNAYRLGKMFFDTSQVKADFNLVIGGLIGS